MEEIPNQQRHMRGKETIEPLLVKIEHRHQDMDAMTTNQLSGMKIDTTQDPKQDANI